jgi:hypothetical protein
MTRPKLYKDKKIIHLIEHLDRRFGVDNFIINDFWDADLCAIGLSDPLKEALIYISTYDRKDGLYFVSIEDINDPKVSTEKSENIEVEELEIIIAKHLKIK